MIKTILHYSLGFNAERGGGLTKYSEDLMRIETKCNKVVFLYPGEYGLFTKSTEIKKEKKRFDIEVYSIVNPLSIPFLCGLKDERYIIDQKTEPLWDVFFDKVKPDLFHIHTLIGLDRMCVFVAHKRGIPIVYTSHDYFGLCAKQTFIYKNQICLNRDDCLNCGSCNATALSKKKLFLLHSKLFCKMRKLDFVKKAKNSFKENVASEQNQMSDSTLDFKLLRRKYEEVFAQITYFHFNSTIAREIFEQCMKKTLPGEVLSITHSDIHDKRVIKDFDHPDLNMLYLGPPQVHKGFFYLIDVLDRLYVNKKNFKLQIYSNVNIQREYLDVKGNGYKYSDLEEIFKQSDLLIVPSQWYETFGFIVAEAKSFGVPVIVTTTVGSKDIVDDGKTGYIVNNESLYDRIENIIEDRSILSLFNSSICKVKTYTMEEHIADIYELYKKAVLECKEEA